MTTHTSYEPGSFCWVELETNNATAAKSFYGDLLGWSFDDVPVGPNMVYTMCKIGDQQVGALYQSDKGVPPHWDAYLSVKDVDATTKLAAANGATVIKEPFDVMDAGRMSVIHDPSGAQLCFWQAGKHAGAGVMREEGALCWSELYTDNVDRAVSFYGKTVGWSAKSIDMGPGGIYTLFKRNPADEESAGGMMAITPNMQGVRPNWLNYFTVVDVDASASKATQLGGRVLMPAMDIPNIGRFSVVADPQGAVFALYRNAH